MSMQRFDLRMLASTPWKNGGGSTREIACWPLDAGFDTFDWRVSVASIGASGPFSVFAGVDRVITLLDGDGVRLQGEGVDHRLDEPLQPFAFSGDLPIDCTLLGGASSDFNVMSRRGRLRADVQVLRESAFLDAAPHGLLLAWRGSWRIEGQALPQKVFATQQGFWWADAEHGWRVRASDPAAILIAVRWYDDQTGD